MKARVISPEEVEKVPRGGIVWIEFFDGELGRSTGMFCAMKTRRGTLVDEEGSDYNDFAADITPDAEGDCWRFWNAKPTAKQRKEVAWSEGV